MSLAIRRLRSASLSSSLSPLDDSAARFVFLAGRTGEDASEEGSAFLLCGGGDEDASLSLGPGDDARAFPLFFEGASASVSGSVADDSSAAALKSGIFSDDDGGLRLAGGERMPS